MTRIIKYDDIVIATAKLAIEANRFLPSDVTAALKASAAKETSELAKFTF
jgi:tartrate dehydratase alpha subunit/fumarate hydratase class I-like protein